ncbi:MAG TPA: hypothetical protein VF161_06295 [Steroidobacteraceae bacterium]
MYNAFQRTNQWPDGGAYLDQPCLVVEVFQIIESQLQRERELKERNRG